MAEEGVGGRGEAGGGVVWGSLHYIWSIFMFRFELMKLIIT